MHSHSMKPMTAYSCLLVRSKNIGSARNSLQGFRAFSCPLATNPKAYEPGRRIAVLDPWAGKLTDRLGVSIHLGKDIPMLQFISKSQANAILESLQEDDPAATLHPSFAAKRLDGDTCVAFETDQPARLGAAQLPQAVFLDLLTGMWSLTGHEDIDRILLKALEAMR